MQVSEKNSPGIYLLALDHKLLNLKNIIDTKNWIVYKSSSVQLTHIY